MTERPRLVREKGDTQAIVYLLNTIYAREDELRKVLINLDVFERKFNREYEYAKSIGIEIDELKHAVGQLRSVKK